MEEGKRIKSRSRELTDRERFCRQVQGDDRMTTSGQADAGWRVSSQSMTRSICCRQAARVLERLEDPILFLRVSSFVRVGGGGCCCVPITCPEVSGYQSGSFLDWWASKGAPLEAVDWQSKSVEIAPVGRDGWELGRASFPFSALSGQK
ncbi:uncharacterized protein BO87DRAFT_26749 [Aspergillus neoniger CBS 115656]|uniref:Uncharacterized protein n=1 Tax=Aspergillus neoniger (strain CBS 115656) TaxID=1448310 RepID=A0A318YL70_ASPNB|nr:hypothetical protein BO87DRAFT_26749 [Aspergillus neoniger CBS 115656]PYH35301.1 hypothetical protein BO87DRAFT_26749 [Aspergillus neoniger CBS 115656]